MRRIAPRLVVGLALICLSLPAAADVMLYTFTQLCPDADVANGIFTFDPTSTQDSQHFEFGGATMDGSASATANYLSLGASASATLTNYAPGTYQPNAPDEPVLFSSLGTAGFQDMWEVFGGTVTDGILHLSFVVSGEITNSGFGGAGGFLNLQNGTIQHPIVASGTTTEEFEIPFTLGTPLDIDVSLMAYTFTADYDAPNPYSYSGTSDFAHTADLVEVFVADLDGNPLSGVTIRTGSGTFLPLSPLNGPGVIPEPASLALVATGLIGMVASRRSRRAFRR